MLTAMLLFFSNCVELIIFSKLYKEIYVAGLRGLEMCYMRIILGPTYKRVNRVVILHMLFKLLLL